MACHQCRKKNVAARIRYMPSANDSSTISDIGANKAELMEQTKLMTN